MPAVSPHVLKHSQKEKNVDMHGQFWEATQETGTMVASGEGNPEQEGDPWLCLQQFLSLGFEF